MRRSSIQRTQGIQTSCLTLAFTLLCLGILFIGIILIGLPYMAERRFGSSSERLEPFQRTYLSLLLLLQENTLNQPLDYLGKVQLFDIQLGESTFDITSRLQTEGFIASGEAMRNFLVYSGLDTSIQAGEYSLSSRMTPMEIAHTLQDATPKEVTFRVLPGWRLEEIAAALPTSGLSFSPDAFIESATDYRPLSPVNLEIPPEASLEGFFYPDSYRFARQITVEQFIKTMLDNFEVKVDAEMRDGFQLHGLTLHQAVTLASIVQREAIIEEEMPLIASVFINRLSSGMKLDSDPTVQYALGYDFNQGKWWKSPLGLDDLKTDSPYNTYLRSGIPPGPISNPGLSALKAVAYPDQSDYYYFRASCNDSERHNFAQTFEEHQQNACP